MKPYKRMSKGAFTMFAASMLAVGGVGSLGYQVFAQTSSPIAPSISTGQAQDTEIDGDDVQDGRYEKDEVATLPIGGITEVQARAAITAKYPGIAIKHIELEDNNGTVVYGANLADKTEVTVDAKTGAVQLEVADQEGVERADGDHSGKDMNEAPGTETNDGPDMNDAETAD